MSRDKNAIRTILKHMGGAASYPDIALRGGEGLASPLMEMVQAGEIERIPADPERDFHPVENTTRYRLVGQSEVLLRRLNNDLTKLIERDQIEDTIQNRRALATYIHEGAKSLRASQFYMLGQLLQHQGSAAAIITACQAYSQDVA
jgi:hypothetical protein